MQQSGVVELLNPALAMIQQGNGAWLEENWLMTPSDLAAVERMVSASQ